MANGFFISRKKIPFKMKLLIIYKDYKELFLTIAFKITKP